MKKRHFLQYMGSAAMAAPLFPFTLNGTTTISKPYPDKDSDAFWKRIREDYILKPDYINLESGYYNIIPTPILNKFTEHAQHVNYEGSYYMRTVQWENKGSPTCQLFGKGIGNHSEYYGVLGYDYRGLSLGKG